MARSRRIGRGTRAGRAAVAAVGLIVASTVACGGSDEGGTPTLRWYSYEEPSGAFDSAAKRCSEASEGRYRIELAFLPNNADEQREQLVRRLAAQDGDIDLMNMDVIWTPEFANARWIRPWPEDQVDAATDGRLDIAVQAASFDDRLYGIPLNTNAQLLWYRKDLVDQPPATWDEMLDAADRLEADGQPWRPWSSWAVARAEGACDEVDTSWRTSSARRVGPSSSDTSVPESSRIEPPAEARSEANQTTRPS